MSGLPPPVPDDVLPPTTANGDDEKVSNDKQLKRQRNRIRAIDELIATEKTYVDNLRLVNELYHKPLKENKLIKPKYIQSLFGEIETLINLNANLLSTLSENKENDQIGQCFLQFIPFLKMYQNYINNHEQSTKLMAELIKGNNAFDDFLKTQRNHEKSKGQTLSSFLILPIQRVPRYELCLREIIKLTPENHGDLSNLKECFEKVMNVNKSINDRINDYHDREKVRNIEARFAIGQNVSLVAPARTYIKEGYLKKVSRKKDIKYLFILFSDLLIYCSVSGSNKLKLHQRMPFDVWFKIKKVDNNRKYGNKCFEINSTQKSFLCICDDNGVRESWFNDISKCLEKMRANRKLPDSKKEDGRILDHAPVWIPDDFSDRCMVPQCMKKFTFTRRRHHCRYCGRLICSSCSKHQLPHFNSDKNEKDSKKQEIVRVGTLCYDKYKGHFPDFDLKVNRKNKSSYSISATPKGADYELNWSDDTDSDSDDGGQSHQHKRILTAPAANSLSKTHSSSPRLAYKPNIKPKPMEHRMSASVDADNNNNNNNNKSNNNGNGNRYQAMINTMQSKLNKERKLNLELQGQIEDLRAENQRLRKSKVDLMTWSNAEIAKYKKEISKLKGSAVLTEGQ